MSRLPYAGLVALSLLAADDPARLRVQARVGPGVHFVGEAIDLAVSVVAADERPIVTAPRVEGAAVEPAGTSFRQVASTGIGDSVSETNLYISRFRLTAPGPGPIVVPPIVARLGDRSGASEPIRLTVKAVPTEGRPASYLRGVGRIEARAEVEPASVRVGQAFEYRLILTGPGARGSTGRPLLAGLAEIPGLSARAGRVDLVSDPPARTIRYMIRPTEPGTIRLPSVAVATFDPALRRYNETRAPAVTVRVVDVPRLDPATLPPVVARADDEGRIGRMGWGTVPGLALAVALGLLVATRRLSRARRLAARLARRSARDSSDGPDLAGRVASGLTTYLAWSVGRPSGVLTPDEAEAGVRRATRDVALADRARTLIARCDRSRFGHATAEIDESKGLAVEAAAVFADLARRRIVGRGDGRPRPGAD